MYGPEEYSTLSPSATYLRTTYGKHGHKTEVDGYTIELLPEWHIKCPSGMPD